MLLEVIVALGLLVFGMVMVALQIDSGLKVARSNDLQTRAMMLVDSKLNEIESGIIQPNEAQGEMKGDFGILYPGYTWMIKIDPTDIEGFYMATITIGYRADAVQGQIDDPQKQIDFEDQGTKILRTAYRLFPKPADVNLERDFGLTEDDMNQMLTALSGINAAAGVGDGTADTGTDGGANGLPDGQNLADLIKSFMDSSDSGSIDLRMLQNLPDDQYLALAGVLESLGFGRGNISQLQQQFQQLQGRQAGVPGLQRPNRGFGGGRRGGGPGGDGANAGGPGNANAPSASGSGNSSETGTPGARGPGAGRGNRTPGDGSNNASGSESGSGNNRSGRSGSGSRSNRTSGANR
jgi:hypothetical protein